MTFWWEAEFASCMETKNLNFLLLQCFYTNAKEGSKDHKHVSQVKPTGHTLYLELEMYDKIW